ncbi:bifunctional DedA family/phosphatase PAP2 family protein [Aquipseudomonas ullengensis]|uniref:Bifunctional DedA family/phosphatase PAP2 family protein n=1 Tax=Aquipseudomonas ullengensis TaxID=2759166 RepID=A0A7W4LI88_9GAMM|nr:bifunctional DedA family/phosphatase PAP2 family protein [Pseudomonas ullengensis]MBB2493674.1 bifunctional DedA family/phosphatase PAP2 family protein [Pseudomonas ullengensis]
MSHWFDTITLWLEANPQWLGLSIFVIACLECLAVAGIVIPGTVVLFTLAVLAGSGSLPLWQTLLLAYSGGLLGDAISYALGRRFHQNIRGLPVLRDHPEWLSGAENYFQRYGVVSLLVGRYIGPLRPMLPLVAGMLDMPFVRFALVSLLAAAGWAVAYMLPGWATGAAMRLPLPEGFWSAAGIVAAAIALMLLIVIHSSLREQRGATAISAALSGSLLIGLLIGWPHLDTLDQGLMTLIQEQRGPAMDSLVLLVTGLANFGTQVAAGVLLTLLLLLCRRQAAALFVTCCMLGTALCNTGLKHLLARARPEVLLQPLETYSLPSGHSSAAFALFLALGILAGRGAPARTRLTWLLLACLPALLIALSRVYLGVHWPTDVLAGALLAGCVCAASLALLQRRAPMAPLGARVWWLILPATLALLSGVSLWSLPEAIQQYRY